MVKTSKAWQTRKTWITESLKQSDSVFHVIGAVTKPKILIDLVNPLRPGQLFLGEAWKKCSVFKGMWNQQFFIDYLKFCRQVATMFLKGVQIFVVL